MTLPISNGKTVLITGINGYIASVLGQLLLTKGYSIRGTTRRSSSSEPYLNGPWAPYKDRVKIYEVPDMTARGAFDDAAKGVHGIFHTASPLNLALKSYEAFIIPAVRGTETIFEAALEAGPQLSSVVITSSVAAVIDMPGDPGYEFTEKDFSTVSFDKASKDKAKGVETPVGVLYAASKTAADRAVWQFKNEQNRPFSVSTINPGVVIGPPLILPSSGSQLNATLQPIYNILSGSVTEIPPKIGSGSYVDVRDVAALHVWAYEHPEKANGERYIACSGFGPPQAAADILHKNYKGTKIADNIPVGSPGKDYIGYNNKTGEVSNVQFPPEYPRPVGTKAERVIGIQWVPFTQSVVETAKVLEPLL